MMRPAVVVHVITAFLSLLVAKGLSMPPKGKGKKKPLSPSPSAAEDKKLTEWMTQASRAFQPGQSNKKCLQGALVDPFRRTHDWIS